MSFINSIVIVLSITLLLLYTENSIARKTLDHLCLITAPHCPGIGYHYVYEHQICWNLSLLKLDVCH